MPDQIRNAGASTEDAGGEGESGEQNHERIRGPLRAIAISHLDICTDYTVSREQMRPAKARKLKCVGGIAYFRSPFSS
jgi:hypothetical protein